MLGTEGDGLAADTIASCDYTVKIPMSHGVDSLNVAAASAVGSWKRCYVQGKSAPFQLTIFAGAPMTQTIYGLILMLQVLTMDPVLWPAAIGIGFLNASQAPAPALPW